MKKFLLIFIIFLACSINGLAQGYYGDEALDMMAKYASQDLTVHVVSKETDSIPDLSFYLVHNNNAFVPSLDTVTINTKPRTNPFTLLGSIKRKGNDLFFKTIIYGQYELHLFVGHKEYIRKFYLSVKEPLQITIKVDEK